MKNNSCQDEMNCGAILGAGIFAIIIMAMTSGCSVKIQTPEAIRAEFQGANGLVVSGKEDSTQMKSYFTNEAARESEVTKRATAPGFFGQVLGN